MLQHWQRQSHNTKAPMHSKHIHIFDISNVRAFTFTFSTKIWLCVWRVNEKKRAPTNEIIKSIYCTLWMVFRWTQSQLNIEHTILIYTQTRAHLWLLLVLSVVHIFNIIFFWFVLHCCWAGFSLNSLTHSIVHKPFAWRSDVVLCRHWASVSFNWIYWI